jgi:hypothetical protein
MSALEKTIQGLRKEEHQSYTTPSRKQKRREHFPTPFIRLGLLLDQKEKQYKNRKLWSNISPELGQKGNPQQNISKSNPAMHKKNYTPLSKGTHCRYVKLFQHPRINHYNPPCQQAKEEKSYNCIN